MTIPAPADGLDDHALAASLATDAGRVLLAAREELAGADARTLKDEGDRRSQAHLSALLARYRPADSVLSEEAADDHVRLEAERVWIIDPLDGTREFSEPPRDDWAVHVALWSRNGSSSLEGSAGDASAGPGRLVAGAVALPGLDLTLSTFGPPAVADAAGGPIRLVVSRTRPPALVEWLTEHLGAKLVPMGSAGAKAMAVVRGEADAYVHAGGQFEWDSAAPAVVAAAAGLHTCRIDGSPLVYNRADPRLPDLVICRPELAAGILDAIAAAPAAAH
ncbi:MAG: 3'(2'),5'-bisphosphate nucleotidase CysQ [Acidimicrobiales bacterium]